MSATPEAEWHNTRPAPAASHGLSRNPFWVLGATTRDDRRRIVELCDALALELGGDDAQKARAALTNPRARLSQEVAWLPGVAPKKAWQYVTAVEEQGLALANDAGISPLARSNLTAAAFDCAEDLSPAAFAASSIGLANLLEEIDPSLVMREINEDREVAGFPMIADIADIEFEIGERRAVCKASVKGALDRMESEHLIEAMLTMVRRSTRDGKEAAPALVEDLVDAYALEVQPILTARADRIEEEIQHVLSGDPRTAASAAIKRIEEMTRAWCAVAKPIQLCAKARGTSDRPSYELGSKIRSFGIALNNDYNLIDLAEQTTNLVREQFAALPELAEVTEIDAEKLSELKQDAIASKRSEEEWGRSVTFRAEVGALFKDELAISPAGIKWKGRLFPLNEVTAVKWGGVRNSINGIPTGTDFKIGVATGKASVLIELRKEATYTKFLESLWPAVCVRLIVEMVQALKAGKRLSFGSIDVDDGSVYLVRSKFFGTGETVRLNWSQVQVWSANGSVVIGARDDKKLAGSASYIDHWNAHILEHVVRGAFKKGDARLSDYLA